MNRKLITTLLALVAISCVSNDPLLDQSLSGEQVSFTLETTATSRVAIDAQSDKWSVAWQEGEQLGGWSSDALSPQSLFSLFSATEIIDDGRSATFTGQVVGENLRLVHPYMSGAMITDGKYSLDLGQQSVDLDEPYEALGDMLPMIGEEEFLATSEGAIFAPAMLHLATIVELELSFSGLDSDMSYTLDKLIINGLNNSAVVDLTKMIGDDELLGSETEGDIEITISGGEITEGGTLTLPIAALPFTLGEGETIEGELHFTLTSSIGQRKPMVMNISKSNTTGEALSFERATHNTINFECQLSEASEYSAEVGIYDLLSILNATAPSYEDPLMSVSEYWQIRVTEDQIPVTLSDVNVDFVAEYDIQSGDDITVKLQAAIDKYSAEGGANIYISAGDYDIQYTIVRSNIHLLFDKDVILRPWKEDNAESISTLFNVGVDEDGVADSDGDGYMEALPTITENVSILGVGGHVQVIVPENYVSTGCKFVFIKNQYIRNFLYANFDIYDNKTKMSSITTSPADPNYGDFIGPTNGLIMNFNVIDAHYGYGLVQTQGGRNITFYNLHGIGGLTLRLETGLEEMNEKQFGGVFDIVGENISSANGHGGVMCGPHNMTNGVCCFKYVTSYSSGLGFTLGESEADESADDDDISQYSGSFATGSSIYHVTATFGFDAQIKTKHLAYIPTEYITRVLEQDAGTKSVYNQSPSFSCVRIATKNEILHDESTFVVKTIDDFDTTLEFCNPIRIEGTEGDSAEEDAHEKEMKAWLTEINNGTYGD